MKVFPQQYQSFLRNISLSLFGLCLFSSVSCEQKKAQSLVSSKPYVSFTVGKKKIKVEVKLACTYKEKEKGLMFVRSMPENEGMLFVFDSEQELSFWMKNTYIPLDMIHLNKKREVVGIVENAKPHSKKSLKVGTPAMYLLEVNAFFARKHGIDVGAKAVFSKANFCLPN